MAILALEASTSSAKAMLWSPERQVLAVKQLPYAPGICDVETFQPQPLADAMVACGAALLREHRDIPVEAVGISSIWHSLVTLDAQMNPTEPGRTWADTSAAPTVARYRSDEDFASRFYHTTGCAMHSAYNIWKWMHLQATGDVRTVQHVSCLPEYLTYALTGRLAISQSCAAGSGFFNEHTLGWDAELLHLAGIDETMLGQLTQAQEALPLCKSAAQALGLPAGLPVAVAGPDGALNHIAAGGLSGEIMTLSVGTSGALRTAHPKPTIPRQQSTWCYYGDEGKYLIGAATSGAGNCVQWFLQDLLGGKAGFAELEAAARAAGDGDTPYFLPFLFGERCPGWDDARRGGFTGVKGSANAGALYRALLEGILFNLYQNFQILADNTGFLPPWISVSGGITQSDYWTQMAADIFNTPLEANTGEHASLLGAAYVAAKAVGVIPSLSGIPAARGPRHEPDAESHHRAMERFGQWQLEYDKSK